MHIFLSYKKVTIYQLLSLTLHLKHKQLLPSLTLHPKHIGNYSQFNSTQL